MINSFFNLQKITVEQMFVIIQTDDDISEKNDENWHRVLYCGAVDDIMRCGDLDVNLEVIVRPCGRSGTALNATYKRSGKWNFKIVVYFYIEVTVQMYAVSNIQLYYQLYLTSISQLINKSKDLLIFIERQIYFSYFFISPRNII